MQYIEFMPYLLNYGNLGVLLKLVWLLMQLKKSLCTHIFGSINKINIFIYFMVIYYFIVGKLKKLKVKEWHLLFE